MVNVPMLPYFEVRAAIAIAFTAVATYYDLANNKNVPSILLYAFVAIGVLFNLVTLTGEPVYAFAIPLAVFAMGFLFYRSGLFGSADAYTFTAISLLIPYADKQAYSLGTPYPFILSVITATTFLFGIAMLAKFIPYIVNRIKKGGLKLSNERKLSTALMAIALVLLVYTISRIPFLAGGQLVLMAFVIVMVLFFTIFRDEVMGSFVGEIAISKVENEDVLTIEKMDPETVKKFKLQPYVDETMMKRLKDSGLATVPVYTKLPAFEPYILIGLVISLFAGDVFFFLAGL